MVSTSPVGVCDVERGFGCSVIKSCRLMYEVRGVVMQLDDWYVGVDPKTGERVYWERGDSEDMSDVQEIPREKWMSEDYINIVGLLLIAARQYKAEKLPEYIIRMMRKSSLSESEKVTLAESFAEDCFKYISPRI